MQYFNNLLNYSLFKIPKHDNIYMKVGLTLAIDINHSMIVNADTLHVSYVKHPLEITEVLSNYITLFGQLNNGDLFTLSSSLSIYNIKPQDKIFVKTSVNHAASLISKRILFIHTTEIISKFDREIIYL